jgi:hypothetical protein
MEYESVTLENSENPASTQQFGADARAETKDHQGKPDPPNSPEVTLPNSPSSPAKQCEITTNIKRDRIDWWTLRMEGFGLFVLCVYTVFTALMWCANKQAADAATRAAESAENSVTQARDNAHLDQRAWVSVKSVKLTAPYSLTTKGGITVTLANTGKTPALDVGITQGGMDKSDNPKMDILIPRRMVIAPGSNDDTIFIEVLPRDPKISLYVRFVIQYWDVFQNRGIDPPHSTTFCGYYPTTQPPFFFNSSGCGTMD